MFECCCPGREARVTNTAPLQVLISFLCITPYCWKWHLALSKKQKNHLFHHIKGKKGKLQILIFFIVVMLLDFSLLLAPLLPGFHFPGSACPATSLGASCPGCSSPGSGLCSPAHLPSHLLQHSPGDSSPWIPPGSPRAGSAGSSQVPAHGPLLQHCPPTVPWMPNPGRAQLGHSLVLQTPEHLSVNTGPAGPTRAEMRNNPARGQGEPKHCYSAQSYPKPSSFLSQTQLIPVPTLLSLIPNPAHSCPVIFLNMMPSKESLGTALTPCPPCTLHPCPGNAQERKRVLECPWNPVSVQPTKHLSPLQPAQNHFRDGCASKNSLPIVLDS